MSLRLTLAQELQGKQKKDYNNSNMTLCNLCMFDDDPHDRRSDFDFSLFIFEKIWHSSKVSGLRWEATNRSVQPKR